MKNKSYRFEMFKQLKAVSTHLRCQNMYITPVYSDAVEYWICMRRFMGSTLSWGKNDWHSLPPLTFCGSVWVRVWAASSKGADSWVLVWFRAVSVTNLIKQRETVTSCVDHVAR